jgi:hypothetical protein
MASSASEASIEGSAEGSVPAAGPTRRRRRLPVIPLLVLLALVGGLVLLVVARFSPQQQIRRLIDRQIKLAVAGRVGQLHATLSPKAKVACGRADFASEALVAVSEDPDFWHLVDVLDIGIDVKGDRAMVTYTITYNGRVVERATRRDPDLYIRWTKPSVLGPKPNVAAQLAMLEQRQTPGPAANVLPPKQYQAARDRIIEEGKKRPILWKKGQWYDEVDSHLHCES